jgi:RNA polymerase sigma-70 factor, ECF subfamily
VIDAEMRGSWTSLQAQLRPFVARRIPTSDVDDVVQNIFLRMQRSLVDLRDDERFGPWLFRLARSAIADHHRRAARQPFAADGVFDDPSSPTEADNENLVEQELAKHVAPFVAALPSPYREALTLTELEGLTQKQAATMLGVPLSTMKSRVQRGRDRLREVFTACCEISLDARGHVLACEPRPDRPVACQCFESGPKDENELDRPTARPDEDRRG